MFTWVFLGMEDLHLCPIWEALNSQGKRAGLVGFSWLISSLLPRELGTFATALKGALTLALDSLETGVDSILQLHASHSLVVFAELHSRRQVIRHPLV